MATFGEANVLLMLPDMSHFGIPSKNISMPTPPAPTSASIMRPFNIPGAVFTAALDGRVPLTIALGYVAAVVVLDRHNASRSLKPSAMSRTTGFYVAVLFHNLFLAIFSAWTFWGMLSSLRRGVVAPFGPDGLAATIDSLCRINGPPGLGNAALHGLVPPMVNITDTRSRQGLSVAAFPAMSDLGAFKSSDNGRMWTEGLNYYGWIFYLSKFYEIIDSFIILLKGRHISLLQTYHHAGAMLCMWAGMRYVSAPIWVFVLVNSFIHSIMYSYYFLATLSIRVPAAIKQALTTMQIAQFIIGSSYAILHLFVGYAVHVDTAKLFSAHTASEDGDEKPQDQRGPSTGVRVIQPCIASVHETFAIWLNVMYLVLLTQMFVKFFTYSYKK